jgi:hypothetical protein
VSALSSGRLIRSLVTAVSTVGLTLVPVAAASAAPAPKTVPLGVKTHCTGFAAPKPKEINTFASVFADSGAAFGTDTNRLVYQVMAVIGDISTGGLIVESRAIRVGGFFRDAHGRQHGRLLALEGLKVVSAGLTYTVNGGGKNELMRTTRGRFLGNVKVGKKVFLAYDFVAPRRAHVDTFGLAAINPRARTSGSEPVDHKTRFRTTGKTFNFGPQEFNFNLQSEVFPDHRCDLKSRSYAIRSDGTETATNRFDVSATKTASSLLVSTTVHKPARTLLTFCTSSNKKERDLTHAIVTRTSNGNHLVTCVAPRRNRFEGSTIYAFDPSAPVSSPSAFHGAVKAPAPGAAATWSGTERPGFTERALHTGSPHLPEVSYGR